MAEMAKDSFAQGAPGAGEAGLNGFFSNTVHYGQLADTQALLVFAREQSAIIFVQFIEAFAQRAGALAIRHRFAQLRRLLAKDIKQPTVARGTASMIRAGTAGEAREPIPKWKLFLKAAYVTHHAQKRLLHHVVSGVLVAAHQHEYITEESPKICRMKVAKRLLIALCHAPS